MRAKRLKHFIGKLPGILPSYITVPSQLELFLPSPSVICSIAIVGAASAIV